MALCARIVGRHRWAALLLAALSVPGASSVRAELVTWDNSLSNGFWSVSALENWDLDRLPGSADTAVFGDVGVGVVAITLPPADSSVTKILLQNLTGAYEFTGTGLTLDRITQTGNSSTFRAINLTGRPAGLTLDVQANTLTMDAAIASPSLTKSGAGTLLLKRSNSISGSMYLQDGLLIAEGNGTLGGTVYLDGGDLRIDGGSFSTVGVSAREDATFTVNVLTSIKSLMIDDAAVIVAGTGSLNTSASGVTVYGSGLAKLDAGTTMHCGKLTLNQDLALSGAARVYAGPLAGSGALSSTASALTLTNAHMGFAGSLIIDGGTTTVSAGNASGGRPVTANNDGIIAVMASGGLTSSTVLLNNTSRLLASSGGGLNLATITVSDEARIVATAANALSGSTVRLNGGGLQLTDTGSTYGGTVEVVASSLIELAGTAPTGTQSIGELRVGDPVLSVGGNANHVFSGTTLTVGGTGLGRIESSVKEITFNTLTLNSGLTLDGTGAFTFSTLSGSGPITKLGTGGLKLSGTANSSQTGTMIVEEGIVTIAGSQAFRGPIAINDGGTLAFSSTSATVTGSITVKGGGVLESGGSSLNNTTVTLAGGKLRLKGIAGGAVTLTAPSAIELGQSGSGVASLSLAGQALAIGPLGGSFITTSMIAAGAAPSSISAPGVGLNLQNVTLGQDLSITAGFTTINSLAGVGSLMIDASTFSLTNPTSFTGVIAINGGDMVIGGGSSTRWLQSEITASHAARIRATAASAFANATLTLNGASQFIATAADVLSGGSVTANPGTLVDARIYNALRNGTVRLSGGRALVQGNSGGQFRILADSTIEMGAANKVQGITVGDSTLTVDGLSTELLEGALTVEGTGLAKLVVPGSVSFYPTALSASLTIDVAGSTKLAGLSGTGSIIKQGAGTLELVTPVDTGYSGGLQILGGTVKASGANVVRANVTLDAGKLVAAAADAISGRTITLRDGGELESTSANGLRGATIDIDGGLLRLSAANSTSSGDVRLLTSTAIAGQGAQALRSLTMGDHTLTLPAGGTFNFDDGVTVNGTGQAKIVGGTYALRLGRLTLNDDLEVSANADVSVGPLSGSGTLASSNARFATLAAASGFIGQVVLTGGSFRSTHSASLGAGTLTSTNATVTASAAQAFSGATLILNSGSTLSPTVRQALKGARVIFNNAVPNSFDAGSATGGEITVNAGSSLSLYGGINNDLAGTQIHLNGGTLGLYALSDSPGGTVNLLADSTINVSSTVTFGSILLGDQTLNVTGWSAYSLGSAFTVNGTGQAKLDARARVAGSFTLNNDLLVTGSGAVTISGLSGGGTLTRRVLTPLTTTTVTSAAQNFTGTFILEEGSLDLNASDALKGGRLHVKGGTASAGGYALRGAGITVDGGRLNLTSMLAAAGSSGMTINGGTVSVATLALDGVPVTINPGGTLMAGSSGALSGATIALAGGAMDLYGSWLTTVGGTVNVTADSTISSTRSSDFGTITHRINLLSLNDNTLAVTCVGGQPTNPVLFSAVEVNIGGTGSAAINNTGGISLARVTLADDLTVSGTGRGSVALLAGSGDLRFTGSGSYTVHKEPASTWRGKLIIDGGSVGADVPSALSGTHIIINSGGMFAATVPQATGNYDPSALFTVNGILSVGGPFLPTITSTSNGVLAVETENYAAVTSLAMLGNGGMFLSAVTAGSIAGPLNPGSSNTWRFGGAGGVLQVNANLHDGPGTMRGVTVGRSGVFSNGTVILAGTNTFTGAINVQDDANLSITGSIASPIEMQGTGTLRLLNSQTFTSIEAANSAVEVGDGVTATVQSMTGGSVRDGGGVLDILGYSRSSTGSFEHRAGQTFLHGNAGAIATPAAHAIARLRPEMKGGVLTFLASQDLDDLLVDETAPLARAILGSGVELRLYDNATSDGIGPSREMIERLWIDVISGYGQGGSGIDLDPAIDRSTYALGLFLTHDAKHESHVLLKPVLHGDIDGSGIVDQDDATIMLASYGAMTPESAAMYTWLEGDLTFDGVLNEYDVGALAAAMKYPYTPSAGPAAALAALQHMANVPEPSAVVLLLPALMLRRRRR